MDIVFYTIYENVLVIGREGPIIMYKKNPNGWRKHLDFLILDLLCLELSFVIAFYIRHHHFEIYQIIEYRRLAVLMGLFDLVVMFFIGTMSGVLRRGYFQEFKRTLYHVLVVIMLVCVYLYAMKDGEHVSRIVLGHTALLYFSASYLTRLLWRRNVVKYRTEADSRSLLLVSSYVGAEEMINHVLEHNYEHYHLCGIVITDAKKGQAPAEIRNIPVIAGTDDAITYASREWVDEVLFATDVNTEETAELITRFGEMGITVHLRLAYSLNLMPDQYVEQLNGMSVLTSSSRYVTKKQLFYKRCLDLAGGLVGSIIAVILMIVIGPMIYKQSPGPILFKQIRVGRNGKKFTMYKLRSMYMDAEKRKAEVMEGHEERDPRMFKLEFDPRIIGCKVLPDGSVKKGIGNFIRDYSLDEFPQFFNVLKGDMSLVGTRPPTVDEWEQYELHHRARLAIKPGITGKWQTSGRSDVLDFEEVVKLDREYIQEWNIGQDIKLILKTVIKVIKHEGAM